MTAQKPWVRPLPLENVPQTDGEFDSNEANVVQPKRIKFLMEARYMTPRDIPRSPDERDPELQLGPSVFDATPRIRVAGAKANKTGFSNNAPAPPLQAAATAAIPATAPSFAETPKASNFSSAAPLVPQAYDAGGFAYRPPPPRQEVDDIPAALMDLEEDIMMAIMSNT